MFEGTEEELKQTKYTQVAIYTHSVIESLCQAEFYADAWRVTRLASLVRLLRQGLSF